MSVLTSTARTKNLASRFLKVNKMYVCAHWKCIHLAVLMPGSNACRNWPAAASKAGTNFGASLPNDSGVC